MAKKVAIYGLAFLLMTPCVMTGGTLLFAAVSFLSQWNEIKKNIPEGSSYSMSTNMGYRIDAPMPMFIGLIVVILTMFVMGIVLLRTQAKQNKLQREE